MLPPVDEIIIVYNSDSGIWGDFVYIAKKLSKQDKCELCEITHTYKKKPEWKTMCSNFEIPITILYRDQLYAGLSEAVAGNFPAVIFRNGTTFSNQINRSEIAKCGGKVEAFENLLRRTLENRE